MSRYAVEDEYFFDDITPEAPINPQVGPGAKPVNPQDLPGNMPRKTPNQTGFVTVLPKSDGGKQYICNIDFFVEGTEPYFELLKVLTEATEQDAVDINIYSYGGLVMTGCHIISAMCNTKATVTTTAFGLCASIGAMIWAAGKIRKVTDNATIMFHMPSGGSFGKCADNEERNRHVQEYFKWFMYTLAKGILTEEDFERVVQRRNDIFLDADTVRQRLAAIENSMKAPVPTTSDPTTPVPEQPVQPVVPEQKVTSPQPDAQPVHQPVTPTSQPATEENNE